jgi:hypothetical protein
MSLWDHRSQPFLWQSPDALESLAAGLQRGKVSTARSIYLAFCEYATERSARSAVGVESDPFATGRNRIAELAGVSVRSVDSYVKEFERLGLLRVKRQRRNGRNLPNVYVLLEPDGWRKPCATAGAAHKCIPG